jgi:hypothetical protein
LEVSDRWLGVAELRPPLLSGSHGALLDGA